MDCSAKVGGKATRTTEFFPGTPRSGSVSPPVAMVRSGMTRRATAGRWRPIGWFTPCWNARTAILPRKPTNPGRVLGIIDDRGAFEEKKRQQAFAIAQDQPLFAGAIDVLHAAYKYDYTYLWSWMGVPIIQLPADII